MITDDFTVARRLAGPSAIALVVIALVGCGSSTKTTTVTTTTPQNTTEQPATQNTTEQPTTTCTKPCADSSGWIAEVSNFKYNVQSGNEFIKPESGNVFVTMDVKFINNSNSSRRASAFDFKLKSAGVEHGTAISSPCESWSSVDVSAGASYGPKCLGFEAAAGKPTGIVLVWTPGLVKSYDIPLEGAATSNNGTSNTSGTAAPLPNQCSPGVSTTQGVPCELASNTFYEYYRAVQNGKDTTALMVWSPAVKRYRTANCSKASGVITCNITGTNVPGAQVQITQAALDAYTPEHASEYAKTHDLGPQG